MKKTILMAAFASLALAASAQTGHGYPKSEMNPSVKPGTNFMEYAAGGYMKAHPLRADQTENGAFEDLFELNQKQINEIIQGFATTPQKPGTLGYKIATIYNQMMDSVGRDKQGYEVLKPWLEKIRAIKDIKEYQRVLARIDRHDGTMMFDMGVGADQRNAAMNIVGISQGGLGLDTKEYYFNDDPQSEAVRKAYKEMGKKFFMLVGYDEATAQKKMDKVYAIEERIAKASYDMVKLRDVQANYHKMTYAELLRDFPGIDWTTVFWETGFPAFDLVNVGQPEPIHEVEKIYADTPLEDLKDYAELRVIESGAGSLTSDFRKVAFDFSKVLSGKEKDDPMWKRATNLCNRVLGEAIGKMYCEKYFPESSKKRMLELVHNLQTALAQRIDEATWMGPETKAQAKDKLANFIIKIGYPDKWKDFSKMEVSDTLTLYENLNNIQEYYLADELQRKVNKPVDKTEWYMTPQTINAYYEPTTNEICFPAGILQPPFFDPVADDAINYGAIGTVIGHEMSHGFDDQGCQFDKTGNERNWWTPQDKKNFDQRAEILAKQFDRFVVVNGKHVNGHQTLGENIGDNGGLNIALRAMRNTGKEPSANNNKVKSCATVIDGFTPDQRFFLAYARVWAGNYRPEYLDMLLTQDVHSPAIARVNAALPMIDDWYKAFNIKSSDKLFAPKNKRARIW